MGGIKFSMLSPSPRPSPSGRGGKSESFRSTENTTDDLQEDLLVQAVKGIVTIKDFVKKIHKYINSGSPLNER